MDVAVHGSAARQALGDQFQAGKAVHVAAGRALEGADAIDPDLREVGSQLQAAAVVVQVDQAPVPVGFVADGGDYRLIPFPPHRRADQRQAAPRAADEEAF